ncbi:DNA polymerase ligase N-terminal domain-containing protein [Mycobacterium malmoense]|uniref:DNA polymerase ligase N-terminal domain-containing protein n=1 Tax=Mycobacterium malmoense TaxID=1780 RepID=UPI0008F86AFC|nr:DNA polymerase ligase N-terminal domain-containing protein [Mycobacterium malmoense]OIN81973.1 DNA ligase [Mycobacterium malmoense]
MPLSEYRRKRRSGTSPEPAGRRGRKRRGTDDGPRFVIQHHAARSDHYDFRLEIDGVLVSWAIPKGPSTNPKDRRMARRTEDHPLEYASFEGVIPAGEYGAGGVIVWDHGTYANATKHEMGEGLERGHLSFRLHGEKLRGGYALTRIREGKDETWLLIKRRDEDADARRKPVRSQPESVLTGRTLDDLNDPDESS